MKIFGAGAEAIAQGDWPVVMPRESDLLLSFAYVESQQKWIFQMIREQRSRENDHKDRQGEPAEDA